MKDGPMDLRTPLARVRGLGSAGDGTRHFWRQRLTAIANVPLSLYLVWFIFNYAGASREALVAALSSPLSAAALLAFAGSATIHMRLGMQVIVEDYVHGEFAKVVLLAANTLLCAAVALVSAFSILKLALGG
jgi:succinate dehydrogenase / fumarate reductase membrane anchor subunit